MAPTREQRQILNAIVREGRNIRNRRARRVYERAAVQTGLVESNLRNLPGGDADSAGWRQERASLYPNPTNIRASVRRFRQEFQQHYDPGERSYEVAAQVQRPAAQYRGRYRLRARDAVALLRQAGVTTGGGDSSPGRADPGGSGGSVVTGPDPAAVQVFAEALAQRRQPQPVSSVGLPDPAFSARSRVALPQGYQQVQGGGGAASESGPSVDDLLRLAQGLRGEVQEAPREPAPSSGRGGRSRSGRAGGGVGRVKLFEMFYDPGINVDNGRRTGAIGGHGNHLHVAAPRNQLFRIAKRAQELGLSVREFEPFDKVDPVHTQGSFHYRGRAADISGDRRRLAQLNREIARQAGVR